jgi:hypothetical protein
MSKNEPASSVATNDERCAYPGCGKIAGTVEHHCTYPAHHDQEREPNTGCHAFVAPKAVATNDPLPVRRSRRADA